jgi:hypothetical protein
MDTIIVGIIVALAVGFMVKRFVDIWKGKKSCGCGNGCSCSGGACSGGSCSTDPFVKK